MIQSDSGVVFIATATAIYSLGHGLHNLIDASPPSMRSKVYVTVECTSVRPSVPSVDRSSGWFAAERGRLQQISIDSWYAAPAGIQQQMRAASC